jgi:MFS family permease
MTTVAHAPPVPPSAAVAQTSTHDKVLFWGCFIALVTTAFGFIARMFLINTWAAEFNLDPAQAGRLQGIGLWPFAVSIIGFSLVIDKIGYKTSMIIAFLGHIIWAAMSVSAYFLSQGGDKQMALQLLYWGSLILALGNGTVESFINPVVATMFYREKTKWLNILHAGWPGGLVIAGMMTIFIDHVPWWIKVGLIALPAVVYFLVLLPMRFPVQERVASGVSYRDMLSEFGILGALVVGFLIVLQIMDFYSDGGVRTLSAAEKYVFWGIGVAIVAGFGLYTRSLGRFLMFFLILIMMPLATTELGTDAWITGIMESVAAGKFHPGWILVYTSAIMMVLRFFAGPIVHKLSPLGLLAVSAGLAIVGLYSLSFAAGAAIFAAATLYGFGKTFFWPTMLGVVSEQMPKGGALTLNAISGIGMLAVGTLGTTYIGTLQARKEINAVASSEVAKQVPGLVKDGKLTVLEDKKIYEILSYQTISEGKLADLEKALPPAKAEEVKTSLKDISGRSRQGALADMIVFPIFMLCGYLILIAYFKARGGYKAEVLAGHMAKDAKFTGGVPGGMEA